MEKEKHTTELPLNEVLPLGFPISATFSPFKSSLLDASANPCHSSVGISLVSGLSCVLLFVEIGEDDR